MVMVFMDGGVGGLVVGCRVRMIYFFQVKKLTRVKYGPYDMKGIQVGEVVEVKLKRYMYNQLHPFWKEFRISRKTMFSSHLVRCSGKANSSGVVDEDNVTVSHPTLDPNPNSNSNPNPNLNLNSNPDLNSNPNPNSDPNSKHNSNTPLSSKSQGLSDQAVTEVVDQFLKEFCLGPGNYPVSEINQRGKK
eukprot:TRINITY_DN7146_c0_g2_i2.p1 TRINITY_DN7146_c0_g2~~TRINITY_DN7146_c0_g2_i2.p1  ORF type:complete len:189 (-),score=51.26 TRINITY_DN7146_c0_g2_i2:196-762(-)